RRRRIAHGNRGMSGGTVAVTKWRARDEDAEVADRCNQPRDRRSASCRDRRLEEEDHVGLADPLVRLPTLHDGEGPPDESREDGRACCDGWRHHRVYEGVSAL